VAFVAGNLRPILAIPGEPRGILGASEKPVNDSGIGRIPAIREPGRLRLERSGGHPYDSRDSAGFSAWRDGVPGRRRAVLKPTPATVSPLVTEDDRRLIEACLAGEGRGWEAFVDRFAGLFAAVAAATGGRGDRSLSHADRDDLVADILLACVANRGAVLRGFAGRSSLATYLTVVARRVAIRRLQRRSVAAATGSPSPAESLPAPSTDAPVRLDDREQVEALLTRLDRDEAQLVRLHHLEARSYGEISRVTGLPLGSIGPALSRARAKLRQLATTPDDG
jgi:RNA polymerase sigma-70 factor (ECF subfamily)